MTQKVLILSVVESHTIHRGLGREHAVLFKVHQQYNIKYVLRLTQLYVYFITMLLVAACFGFRRPLSGQYL